MQPLQFRIQSFRRTAIVCQGGRGKQRHLLRCDIRSDTDRSIGAIQHEIAGGRVITRVDSKILPAQRPDLLASSKIARGFLDTNDTRQFRQPGDRLRQHVTRRPSRHIVKYQRQIHLIDDSLVVQEETFLGRPIVVRSNRQTGISTRTPGRFGQFNCLLGRIATSPRNNRYTAINDPHGVSYDLAVFRNGQRCRLSRGTYRHNGRGAFFDMPFQQFCQFLPVNIAFRIHGRDERYNAAGNHASSSVKKGVILLTPPGVNKVRPSSASAYTGPPVPPDQAVHSRSALQKPQSHAPNQGHCR